ncbi:Protein kinase C eta type [Dictyocoela muelleri]|nr:Protein kinase C eta type [Dictyocoela muelleri]
MDDERDKKLLDGLKKIKDGLKGIQKESCEYRISQLEKKLAAKEMNMQGVLSTSDICSKEIIDQKIQKEKNIISGYKKMILLDENLRATLDPKINLSNKKISHYNNLVKKTKENPIMKGYGVKMNGVVNFEVQDFSCDPMFGCESIDFYVDDKLKTSIKPNFRGPLSLEFSMSREFEILILGKENILLGIIFFPCCYFINYKNKQIINFIFDQNATLSLSAEFQKEAGLLRKNAEVICIYKMGHALYNYYNIMPYYCCVCDKTASLQESYHCSKCRFTCHKKCSNFILYNCPASKGETDMKLTKRYDIAHTLEKSKGSGFRWCGHCGIYITINSECSHCKKCSKYFHVECTPFIFNSCQLDYELRVAMANFKPPAPEKTDEVCTISVNDFNLIKVLGRGSFGKVMFCKHKESGNIVALKILKKEMVVNSNNIAYLDLERKILKMVTEFNHPFLMKMLYCFQDSQNVYFGTEFLAGGDLFHAVYKEKLPEERIKLYACEILLGLEFLHNKGIIYRDMKLDNVLIGGDGHIRIADFGLCKENLSPLTKTYTLCGTPDTLAPEVIINCGYTKDADWWSFGVVLYEMYETEPPFNGMTDAELNNSILNEPVEFATNFNPKAQDLIVKLLEKEPQKRIGYGMGDGPEIRKHDYFEGINWDDVLKKKIQPSFIPVNKLEENFDDEFMDEPILITPAPSLHQYDRFFTNFK